MRKTAGTFLLSLGLVAGARGVAIAQEVKADGRVDVSTNAPPAGSAERELLAEVAADRDAIRNTSVDKDADKEWAERESKLNEAATLTGGIGLVHTQHAQGGAVGQFRVGFTTEYFSSSFLCTSDFPCVDPHDPTKTLTNDSADHIGGRLTLSMDIAKWLEAYLATSALANSNTANRPSLIQVLGDSTLGGKVHGALSDVFHVGGAFELWLVNGTGSVGLDGAGTSAKFRAMGTADLRNMEKPIPLRFSVNTTYVLDNSGEVVNTTEQLRGNVPITRVERYGLNINRVDHFDIAFGAELFAAEEKVRPFLEYEIMVPVNRQDYRCRQTNASKDHCLLLDPLAPSTLTLGSRFYPWKKGFNLVAALDIGISGVGTFLEEMRPTPPWMLYLGAGWAFDTEEKPPVVKERVIEHGVRGRKIRGFVHEEGRQEGIAGAIVSWDNHPELTSLATGTDGSFMTQELSDGAYSFTINAEGYKTGQCSTSIVTPRRHRPAKGQPPPPPSGGDLQLDCVMQALPRIGTIVGKVKDLETGAFVSGAALKVVDVAKKELSGSSDAQGAFRFEQVTPGEASITVDANDYLAAVEKLEVKVRQENPIEVSIKRKPKNALVTLGGKEIIIKQQVQFAVDSAQILPASTGLLVEIADVLLKNPRVRRVEVQGHTDTSGTPPHNMKLSEDRAAAVVAWLIAHGIAADRLVAKGYGDTKPIVPNVTELNKQRNRRVQLLIVEQDPAAPPPPALGAPALGSGAAPKPQNP